MMTFLSDSVPLFRTQIVNEAVPPSVTCCVSLCGFSLSSLMISILGWISSLLVTETAHALLVIDQLIVHTTEYVPSGVAGILTTPDALVSVWRMLLSGFRTTI